MTTPGGPRRPGRPRGRGRRFFPPRRRVCSFCVDHVAFIDYKDAARLRRFLSERARIEPRRKTGTCASHQRALSLAIRRARHLALLPYVGTVEREPSARPPRPEMPPREPRYRPEPARRAELPQPSPQQTQAPAPEQPTD